MPTTTPPTQRETREQDATNATRPELRFTLPSAGLVSAAADTAKDTRPSPAKSEAPQNKSPRSEENKKPRHTEVETESEDSDDESGSEAEAL